HLLAWVVCASARVPRTRRSPPATLAWMFAFIALPVLSGVYYLVFGPRRLHRRRIRYKIARGLLADDVSAYLRSSCGRTIPQLSADAKGLAEVGTRLGQGNATFAIEATLLDDGDRYFEALGSAIAAAEHHVHMEYYIWEPDEVGTRIRNLLIAARERDVRVRVLFDSVGSPNAKRAFWAPLRAAGGDVLEFNPIRIALATINFANFRTHRKIAAFDGSAGFLGGMNLHDPAHSTRSGKDAWRDESVRIVGEPVRRLQRIFLENWIYSGGNFMLT